MFIGTSTVEHYIIVAIIYSLRSITPLSFLHLFLACLLPGYPLRSYNSLNLYALVESTFYFFVYLPRKTRIQNPAVHPPRLSHTARSELLNRCRSNIPNPEDFLSGWHLPSTSSDTTIKKENIKDWLLWGFFSTYHTEPEIEDEVNEYVQLLEESLGRKLPDGRNESVKSIRLTLDNVVVYHRPFIYYMAIMLVDTLVALFLLQAGFRHYTSSQPTFPPRPYTLFSSRSSETLSYWYRPPLSPKSSKQALLFLHGIGIGLFPYAPMLRSYANKHPERPIVIPELLHISSRLTSPPSSQSEFRDSIRTIFKRHGIKDYSITAHSYGTGLATCLIKPSHLISDSSPNNLPPPSSLVLLDPISLLLHLPSVARNFLYRPPKSANEHELYYFACTDPGVAHTLTRHFFWSENIVWKEELANVGRDRGSHPRVAIVLSGKDIILDAPTIWTYLTGQSPPTDQAADPWPFVPPTPHPSSLVPVQCNGVSNILAMYLGGLDHAQMFLAPVAWKAVIDMMDQVAGIEQVKKETSE